MTYFEKYDFENGETILTTFDGEEEHFCPEVKIVEAITSLEDGSQTVKISLHGAESFEIPREVLVGDLLKELTQRGLSIPRVKEYEVTLSEILFKTEKSAGKLFTHKRVGFHEANGKIFFFGESVCSKKFQSRYVGNLNLQSKGNFDDWQTGVAKLAKEFPAVAIALAMGASAPIAYLLNREAKVVESPIFSIIGRSSVGKTTMLKLSASAWGKADFDGIINTIAGTEAGFFAAISGKNGFPHFVDETSLTSKIDFTNLIYEISMNQEGNKCLSDGSLRPSKRWFTSVTFTGEKSLLANTNRNSGLYARVCEFDIPWFKGEAVAKEINSLVSKNYGTAYPVLIEVLKKKRKLLSDMLDSCNQELKEKFPACSSVGMRLLSKYAILLMTVDVIVEAWSLEIDRNAVIELLLQSFKQCLPDTDVITAFYEKFLFHVSCNAGMYPRKSKDEALAGTCWGVKDYNKCRECIWIAAEKFEELLRENGLGYSEGVLKELYEHQMIEYFGDRYRKKHTIGIVSVNCFCVYLGVGTADSKKPTASKVTVTTKKKKLDEIRKSSKIKSLLEEEEDDD